MKTTLYEALHREWQRLADEIAHDDPDESHCELQVLRLQALTHSEEYARRKRAEEIRSGLWVC